MRKHRAENQLKTGLSHLKQQLKRSQLLASGTPEGDRMKKDAKERKRQQRQREKEKVGQGTEGAAEKGEEVQGDSSLSSPRSSLSSSQSSK